MLRVAQSRPFPVTCRTKCWSLTATFAVAREAAAGGPSEFDAALVAIDGRPVATGAASTVAAGSRTMPRYASTRPPHAA